MTVDIKVFGNVQGVFFRREAKAVADRLGIGGWVRNNADGSVEVVASGSKEKLDQFIKWCKKGPALAKIEKVEEDWFKEAENFEDFSII